MGSKQSAEKPIESQSIITHSQQHYSTNTNEQSEQHFPVAEARILSNNLSRHIDPEDDKLYHVANYQGAASSQDPNKKSLKISFDRRDTSAPLALTLDNITRQDNWPPLPSFCPVGPCFYQDINVDIPLEFQKIVRMLYYLWMFHVLMLMLNILGGLGMFIALADGATFGLAIVYFALFTPFSYVCWFRPIYKAFRSDSSFNFMVFFFVFSFQLIVSIINAIGIPSMGSCGWVTVGKAFSSGYTGLGVFLVLIATAASVVAAAMVYAIIWVHRIYRSTGASFAKAQAEFSQGVMRNEHVQTATANAASAVIRNQMNQATSGGANSASPRF